MLGRQRILPMRPRTNALKNQHTMRITQITDLHIAPQGERPYGIDVRAQLDWALNRTRELRPDRMVVSGDLCFQEGEAEVYQLLKSELDRLDIPYDVISGNHDDASQMARIFGQKPTVSDVTEVFYRREWEGRPILFLDTTPRRLSGVQWEWLERQVHAAQASGMIIFMHHPPVCGGVPYMDQEHNFLEAERFQQLLAAYPGLVHVFCGHYHVEKTVQTGNLLVHITPACFFQIDQHEEHFAVDHRRPALRLISMNPDQLASTVVYGPEAKVEAG